MNFISRAIERLYAAHLRARCERKVRYGHKETAEQACIRMESKGSVGLTAYACAICGGWHIGHDYDGTEYE